MQLRFLSQLIAILLLFCLNKSLMWCKNAHRRTKLAFTPMFVNILFWYKLSCEWGVCCPDLRVF